MPPSLPEPVRLVIWDLDETFWGGTLSEGGIAWRPENERTVHELSRRGIINSICSKNDIAPVESVLAEHGLLDQFVFTSISWDAKGPRLARLIEAIQLRPESVLFIDDNPMNRAEAKHFLPGLQVEDETIVPALLDDPRLQGKPDPDMTRLAQYRLLHQRHRDQQQAGGDTADFLRGSGITVCIEHDLTRHMDRAIELINRTNQLNFLKQRLPENIDQAREQLGALLANHSVQAGIVQVRDNYGDYGYCGLYITKRTRAAPKPELLQFAFSCRILGMGIETWLYDRLGRPDFEVAGEVLTDVVNDRRQIDWITVELPGVAAVAANARKPLAYVLARGGCDMRALSHYFDGVADEIVEEFADVRNGMTPQTCNSILAAYAIRGVPEALVRDSAVLGFEPEDFHSAIAAPPPSLPALWLLNFTLEQGVPMLTHRETGLLMPASMVGVHGPGRKILGPPAERTGMDPALRQRLRAHFDDYGLMELEMFRENLELILGHASPQVRIFILLANERRNMPDGSVADLPRMIARNRVIKDVARAFGNVELITPSDHMSAAESAAMTRPHHYGRMVYFAMFRFIMDRLSGGVTAHTAAAQQPEAASA